MTIDEAITHAEEVAEENEKFCYKKGGKGGYFNEDTDWNNARCAEEHRQLAEWLKDYKELKAQLSDKDATFADKGTTSDTISRQAAIDAIQKAYDRETLLYRFVRGIATKTLNNLPSAQPEIVRCKDCKHRYTDECPMQYTEWVERDEYGEYELRNIVHDYTEDDGFCNEGDRDE